MRRLVPLVAVATALSIATSGCYGSEDARLPAPVTLDGVAGVTTLRALDDDSMTWEDVQKAWNMKIPLLLTGQGSTNVEIGIVCAGEQQGVLIFVYDNLQEMRFYSGAVTDRGVGIGSTRSELRKAYGSRLERGGDYSFRVRSLGPPPRHAIGFDFFGTDKERVSTVRFSWAQVNDRALGTAGVAC